MLVWPVIASTAVFGRVGVGLGTEGFAAVDAGGDVGRDPGIGGVVAGIAPRDDQGPGRLVDRDLRLELGPAGDLVVARSVRSIVRLAITVGGRLVVVDELRAAPGLSAVVGEHQEDVGVGGRVL